MWFELRGDERLKRCTSEGCYGQQTWRLESGGVGSNYCSGCKEKINSLIQREAEIFVHDLKPAN